MNTLKADRGYKAVSVTEAERKEYGLNILKQVLSALHDKRFADINTYVDEHTMEAEDYEEYIQGTVDAHELNVIDAYDSDREPKDDFDYEIPPSVFLYLEYDITADGGEYADMCIRLEVEFCEDGKIKSSLDIQPA